MSIECMTKTKRLGIFGKNLKFIKFIYDFKVLANKLSKTLFKIPRINTYKLCLCITWIHINNVPSTSSTYY